MSDAPTRRHSAFRSGEDSASEQGEALEARGRVCENGTHDGWPCKKCGQTAHDVFKGHNDGSR